MQVSNVSKSPNADATETDEKEISKRYKHLSSVKQTPHYKKYIAEVPKRNRRAGVHARTPDPYKRYETPLEWMEEIKRWREFLVEYEPRLGEVLKEAEAEKLKETQDPPKRTRKQIVFDLKNDGNDKNDDDDLIIVDETGYEDLETERKPSVISRLGRREEVDVRSKINAKKETRVTRSGLDKDKRSRSRTRSPRRRRRQSSGSHSPRRYSHSPRRSVIDVLQQVQTPLQSGPWSVPPPKLPPQFAFPPPQINQPPAFLQQRVSQLPQPSGLPAAMPVVSNTGSLYKPSHDVSRLAAVTRQLPLPAPSILSHSASNPAAIVTPAPAAPPAPVQQRSDYPPYTGKGLDFYEVRRLIRDEDMLRYVQSKSYDYARELDTKYPDLRRTIGRFVINQISTDGQRVLPCGPFNRDDSCPHRGAANLCHQGPLGQSIHACSLCYFCLAGIFNFHRQTICPLLALLD